ncbi:zinc-binding metallopeptidase family protein [Geminicoccus flavidas]|uniref:zinc-binding metallopeptidase family protein n=1 Tax=Geminicoccus flavidas TaxID=2506407 RepID=UPI001356BA37|nr:putative zinc-binding peptidase [Geminicoccus flavidas]
MKLFECQHCGQLLYFENTLCMRCGHRLGYLPDQANLSALEPEGNAWRPLALPDRPMKFCVNAEHDLCNWMIPAESSDTLCRACRHNRTIPDISDPVNLERWRKIEFAKHRLIYTLIALRLPLYNLTDDPEHGLAFDFLSDQPAGPAQPRPAPVMTGHDQGLITLNIAEADDVHREKTRHEMGEPYRTLLGHFRHEVGHHYWDILVCANPKALERCRALFGDERQDYGEALKRHYAEGPPADWQENYVSAYATTHPWEDFAETWTHYLHIVDTLETAAAFGLKVDPKAGDDDLLSAEFDDVTATRAGDIQELIDAWLPLTFAVNSLNRSMGQPDLYPFVLSPAVIEKLGFIHDLVHRRF